MNDVAREDQDIFITDKTGNCCGEEFADKRSLLTQNIFSLLFNSLWAYYFFVYTTREDKYGGSQCITLRFWGLAFAIYSTICVGIRILVILPLLIVKTTKTWMHFVFKTTDYYEMIAGFVFLIAFTVVHNVHEQDCGALMTLTFTYLLVIYFMICLMMACVILTCLTDQNKNDEITDL